MSKKDKTKLANKTKFKITILSFILVFIVLIIFWSYTPKTTLQWIEYPGLDSKMRDICGGYRIYPPTVENCCESPFPLFSNDGRYYANLSDNRFKRNKSIRIFRSDGNQEIGRYYSSYPSIEIYCWAEDSSGIYVADYKPSQGYGGIFTPSPKTGPVKKLLVP